MIIDVRLENGEATFSETPAMINQTYTPPQCWWGGTSWSGLDQLTCRLNMLKVARASRPQGLGMKKIYIRF